MNRNNMNVFCPYPEPIMVARCLDPKRLNRQIQEAKVILNAIRGEGKGWFNHPITKMYREYYEWLEKYMMTLIMYKRYLDKVSNNPSDDLCAANNYNRCCNEMTPSFLTKEFCDQHKRRLYTKNKEYYKQFAVYGESEENWYFVGDEIVKYINGKRIN